MPSVLEIDPHSHLGVFPIKSAELVTQGDLVGVDSNGDVLLADMNAVVEAKGFAYFGGVHPGKTSATGTSVRANSPRVAIYREGKLGFADEGTLTNGARVYLSATPGGYKFTQPSVNNELIQEVGWAVSTSEVQVMIRPPIIKFQTSGSSTAALY